jgi:Cu/Ag efflux pump CusA
MLSAALLTLTVLPALYELLENSFPTTVHATEGLIEEAVR